MGGPGRLPDVTARTGPDGLRRFYDERPDLVILDVALPGLDGWQLLERLREFSRVPILMVTARGSEAEKIRGLKLGADDYITKPVSFPELIARVEAALRRAATSGPERPRRIRHGEPRRRPRRPPRPPARGRGPAHPDGVPAAGIPRGACRPARDPSPGPGAVWGAGYDRDVHLLRMTIRNLRMKLDAVAPGESFIATEYGLGYRLVGPRPTA